MAAHTSLILPLLPRYVTLSRPSKPKLRIRRMRFASSSSFVVTAPPSKQLMTLVAWKLKHSARPTLPIMRGTPTRSWLSGAAQPKA